MLSYWLDQGVWFRHVLVAAAAHCDEPQVDGSLLSDWLDLGLCLQGSVVRAGVGCCGCHREPEAGQKRARSEPAANALPLTCMASWKCRARLVCMPAAEAGHGRLADPAPLAAHLLQAAVCCSCAGNQSPHACTSTHAPWQLGHTRPACCAGRRPSMGGCVTPLRLLRRLCVCRIAELRPDVFFLGAGEVDLKVGFSAADFVAAYKARGGVLQPWEGVASRQPTL